MFLVHILAVLIVGVAVGGVAAVSIAIRFESKIDAIRRATCPTCRFIHDVTEYHENPDNLQRIK